MDAELAGRFGRMTARHEALAASALRHRAELQRATRDETTLRMVVEFFRVLLARRRHESEVRTARLGTLAWQEVFADQELELLIRPVAYRGQSGIEFWFKTPRGEARVKGGMGHGGAPHLLGFVLRLLTVLRHPHLERLLILDEPLIQVSREYHRNLAKFLHRICHDLGFRMLVVSHMETLQDVADRRYSVEPAAEGATIKRIR